MTVAVRPHFHSPTHRAAGAVRSALVVSVPRRRALQLALAALWLLDAALQYQPYMFTKAFVNATIAPAAQGNPAAIAGPIRLAVHLLDGHPAVFNGTFATIQLAIALGLLWPRTVKLALGVSIVWSVGLWWLGEGLGGVLTGASPVMGAPGAVIFYAVIAFLVWPRAETGALNSEPPNHRSVAFEGALGQRGAQIAWAGLWGLLTYLFLLPANRAPGALHDSIAGSADGQPAWLAGIDGHLASLLTATSTTTSVIVAAICYLIAISAFVPRLTRTGIATAVALGTIMWVAQGLGGVFTGRGTDPNSGVLLVLLAAAYWPRSSTAPRRAADLPATAAAPRRPRTDRHVGLLAAAALGFAGISAGIGFGPSASATPLVTTSMSTGMNMPAGSMPEGMGMRPAARLPASAPPDTGPSDSARMVCSAEVHRDIATALGLPTEPSSTSTWAGHLYTCTYALAGGPFVIEVKELPSVAAAHSYFGQMRRDLPAAQPLLGLASLGLPGYQTPNGTVIFLKDDKTLSVDAAAMNGPIGSQRVSRTDFAYQIATDILGCWNGK